MRDPIRRYLGLLSALMLALMTSGAAGEQVVAHLSQTQVSITTDFEGSEIMILGAVRREAAIPEEPLEIVVTLMGPITPVTIRKRERTAGVWVNGPAVRIDAAPSLYAVASTRPLLDVLSHTENLRHRIGLEEVIRLIDAPDWLLEERGAYREAVMRLRRDQGLYFTVDDGVSLLEETLFFTSIPLPADLVEGDYRARVFLLRDKAVIDSFEAEVAVQIVGIERLIRMLATESPAVYGVLSVVVALLAGWGGSALFRWLVP
ncbi:MAG: TIGR02186 family protein [Pseudomonadota bacterium]